MKRQMTVLSSIALGGLLVLNNSVDVNAAPALNPYNGVKQKLISDSREQRLLLMGMSRRYQVLIPVIIL